MAKSLQDILKRRQQGEFVGRDEQLSFFHRNLRWEIDDPRRRFIINISGQGGVGKTWLLRRFRKIAEEFAAVTAYTDETEEDVPGVMGRVAEQCEAQEHPLKTFTERYKVYRQRRQEIEADPDAPQGFPAFLGRTLAKGGLRLARRVPVGGAVADFVDEEAFAELGSEFASYVAHKIGNKDEVQLVMEPVEVLTPLFLADLRGEADKRAIALFFDTYERSGAFLDSWLRDLLEGRYGYVSANILFVIAGRDTLDRNLWAPYEGLLARLLLDPFTEDEAREYLTRKGVTNERVVEVILRLSGRLPLLVAMLAAERPDDLAKVGDPSGEAVERFLKWVEDPRQRQVALDAALPRRLNRDVLAVLVRDEEADDLFTWLREMPFIEKRGSGWAYHDVVRAQMLRYKWQASPQNWVDLHGQLASYYEGLQDASRPEAKAGWKDKIWQGYVLEALYHRLCQAPQSHLPVAFSDFLVALRGRQETFVRRLAEAIHSAGVDNNADDVKGWGQQLLIGAQAYWEDRDQAAIKMLSALLDGAELQTYARAMALAVRGAAYGSMGDYSMALADFNHALELNPDDDWAIARRGLAHLFMTNYPQALADFNQALELDPNNSRAIAYRAEMYRLMREYAAALADFNQAVELWPDEPWVIAGRGLTYLLMNQSLAALDDFNQAVELGAGDAWVIAWRGETYREIGDYLAALADFNRAIELNPDYAWVIASRGQVYQVLERYEEALADFDRAIELKEGYAWAIVSRGQVYHAMARYEEALADFDRAIELKEGYAWAIATRGETYRDMERYQEALADFDRAIDLDSNYHWAHEQKGILLRELGRYGEAIEAFSEAERTGPDCYTCIAHRGKTYRQMERYEEALADFDRAIELEPDDAQAIGNRGQVYHTMARYEEALADFDQAIELNPDYTWAIAQRGVTYSEIKCYDEAVADLTRAIELKPEYDWAFAERGFAYREMKHYGEALADFNRAIELDPKYAWAFAQRGITYRKMKHHDEALADFNRAIELETDNAWTIAQRGITYGAIGRYQEALADFDRATELKEDYAWAIAHRGETYRLMERYEEALADFDRAIELEPDDDWYLYDRAITYHALDQIDKAQVDLTLAILRAREAYEKASKDWRNTLNLGLYHLAAGEAEHAERFYREVLSGAAPPPHVLEAMHDLEDFLHLFPNHTQAQAMHNMLQKYLQEAEK